MKVFCNTVKDKHCPSCGYKTNSRGNMRLHINTQHLGKTAISKNDSSADLFASFGEFCPFCTKIVGNIPLHLSTCHKESEKNILKTKPCCRLAQ